MSQTHSSFGSLKIMMTLAKEHRKLGHRVTISEWGVVCWSCGWNFTPLIITKLDMDVEG